MILQAEKARINNQLTQIDSEISRLQTELEVRRQSLEVLITAENSAVEVLGNLKMVLTTISEVSPDAIATLKSAVLGIFPNDGNDSGGNQPDSPTPPDSPNSDNYDDADDSDEPELLCLNGLTGDFLLDSDEPDATEPQALEPGNRFWFGCQSNTGTVIKALDSGEYLCQIDGAIGEVALDRPQLHYINEPLAGQTCDWYEAPQVGQACELPELPAPFIELITHPDNQNIGYQRKHDGEIICTYFGFSSKKVAQSWKEFIEAIAFRVELRQAQRMTDCRWEIKAKGMAMNQIDRLAKNCDFSKAYQPQAPKTESPAQAAGIEPPGAWGKVSKTPILEEGDICQVLEGQFKDQQGAVCSVSRFSEKPIGLQLPSGVVRYFYRTELKLVSKGSGEPKPQKQQLQSGQVLMGSRVVTTGNYIGVARQVKEANAQRGTFDKLAAIELVKAGLTPEQALATATGQQDDASDF